MRCSACGEELTTPLGCASCGVLHSVEEHPDPYELFGIERDVQVDQKALRKKLMRFSRLVHPDFFGDAEPEVRELAERNSSQLNAAFGLLSDDYRRAEYLVESLGGPTTKDVRDMPQAFLMEVMEWNETLEEARGESSHEALEDLTKLHFSLQSERSHLIKAIEGQLTPLPEHSADVLGNVRRQLNAIRYIDRALHEIEELRLERASEDKACPTSNSTS